MGSDIIFYLVVGCALINLGSVFPSLLKIMVPLYFHSAILLVLNLYSCDLLKASIHNPHIDKVTKTGLTALKF